MPDLNNMMADVQRRSSEVEKRTRELFGVYEELYRQSNRTLMEQRVAANASGMTGFEQFYSMVQTVRRNRDVVGSMLRAISNLRALYGFKVIEENVPEEVPKKEKRKVQKEIVEEPVIPQEMTEESPVMTGDENA